MNIDWVIPCRFAEVHDNLATLVGAGIDTFWFADFPAGVQVGFATRLLATANELGPEHEHTVRSIIRDPRGETLSDLGDATFRAGSAEQAAGARTDWLNGIALVTVIQFEAAEAGTYTFEYIVDDSSNSVPLHVVHGLPGGAAS